MPPRTPSWAWQVATATALSVLALGGLTGCEVTYAGSDSTTPTTRDATDAPAGDRSAPGVARDRLNRLTIATAASMRGYSRDRFPHWRAAGANCDVRDSVLKRDGKAVKVKGCNVVAGTWVSSYDGKRITDPSQVDVDHMVPLANAWRSGAAGWTDAKRGDFANDLKQPQLIAVSAASNRAKGDQDPSTWKPKLTDAWCPYAQDWIAVKTQWKLSATTAERAALQTMLETCR